MTQPASLHPASTNATTQASSPPPTHYYLARYWCSGARPRNAMNLVCRKSKIGEKTGRGARGRIQALPGAWEDCLAGSPRSERSGKRPTLEGERINERGGGRGREHSCLAHLYNGSRSMPPCCTSPPPSSPPPPPASTIFLLFHFFWWHH